MVLGPKILPDFLSIFSMMMFWKSRELVLDEKLTFK